MSLSVNRSFLTRKPLRRSASRRLCPRPLFCVPSCTFSLHFGKSPYGAVFRLSTKIGSAPIVYTNPMTGDQILRCFGFSSGRSLTDLGVLAAVGVGGFALAFVFLKRSR